MIPDYVKDQIKERDIVSIIQGEGVELRREGSRYKCCCPFHGEKTPSFVVTPSRNMYHCFGCGRTGDAISFVMERRGMTFYEAVEYLAGKLGIEYEKREQTPEEKAAEFRRSQMMTVNKLAAEWFIQRYRESPGAREYVLKRRGIKEETAELFCLGYAPEKGGLKQYLTGLGWKEDVLLAAGLVKRNEDTGQVYDSFRHRIMFPVFWTSGYIAGFSGRYIGDKPGVPKYLNTGETELYKKKGILFGWLQANMQIYATKQAYLVEGNLDVCRLHEIGVKNAVAPCGTALTQDQIDLLKSRAERITIIGDTDEAGIEAVQKNAKLMTEAGLSVSVMELPPELGKDADEFFRTHQHEFDECNLQRTNDYIPWICKRWMEAAASQTEKAAVITEVCKLLAKVPDQSTADMYRETFTKAYKFGRIWNQEYFKAKNDQERAEAKEDGTKEMLQNYGFYVKNNCYYGASRSGNDVRWSNFTMTPILHIRDEKNARRIFTLRNVKMQEAVVKLNQSELVSFTDFKTRVETAGNYVWEATANELTSLKKFLYDGTPSADEIKQLGWQKKWGFYAWGNGGLDNGTFKPVDKYGIIDIKGQKFYLPGCALDTRDNTQGYQLARKFVYTEANTITLREYSEKLITVFGDNAKVALCFLFASLFKDVVTSVTTSFPILDLFGPKGTGKSELGHSLTSFFVTGNIAPNINNTTKAALAEAVAEVSNAVVHLDEYKNNLDLEKREFLKGIWDGAGRSRMNMDNDKRRETTAVDCGVVMSGQEMPTADIALFNRLVFLTFSKTTFSDQEKRNYENLKLIEKRGLTHLTNQLLQLRSKFQTDFRRVWDETLSDMNDRVRSYNVEDRTLRNWAILLAAYRALRTDIDVPFDSEEIFKLCCKGCVDQNQKTKQNNELSGFWEIVENLVASGQAYINIDYKLCAGDRPFAIKESDVPFEPKHGVRYIYLAFQRLSALYMKEGKDVNGKVIPRDSLKYYLEHSPEFIGTAKSMRFKLLENKTYVSSNPETGKSRVTTAMVFDYDALKVNYGIDLDISTDTLEIGDNRTAASAPPSVTEPAEAVDAELWEE